MEPQRVDPFTGVFRFLGTLATGNPFPNEKITTKLPNITVDTSLPEDTQIWETGIKIEGKWLIVEQYPDKEAAQIGHKKWVGLLTEYPDFPLKDIDMWSLNKLKEG